MHHLQNTLAKYFDKKFAIVHVYQKKSLQLCIVKIVFSWGPKHVDNHFHKIQKFCSNLKSMTSQIFQPQVRDIVRNTTIEVLSGLDFVFESTSED